MSIDHQQKMCTLSHWGPPQINLRTTRVGNMTVYAPRLSRTLRLLKNTRVRFPRFPFQNCPSFKTSLFQKCVPPKLSSSKTFLTKNSFFSRLLFYKTSILKNFPSPRLPFATTPFFTFLLFVLQDFFPLILCSIKDPLLQDFPFPRLLSIFWKFKTITLCTYQQSWTQCFSFLPKCSF